MRFKELRSVLPTDSVYKILHLYAGLDLPREVAKPSLCRLVEELGYDPGGNSPDAEYDTGNVDPFHVAQLIRSHGDDEYLTRLRELEDHVLSRFDSLEVERVHASYDGTFTWLHVQLAVPKPKITVH